MIIIEFLESVLRWGIFLCMMSGYIYIYYTKARIQIEFVPIIVCSSIAVIIFLGGMIGLLLPTTIIVIISGVIGFFKFIKNRKKYKFMFQYITYMRIGLVIGCFCFLLQTLHTNFIHYDNFSHWAIVVKEMLITHAFPSADSLLIDFKNYPLGASSFIYFVCTVLGTSQSYMVFAQGILIFSCFAAIFGIITEKKRFLLSMFLATGFSILSIINITIRINNLLVDFLLPCLALAIIAVIYRYRENLEDATILICPMLGFLVIIKSIGIIYTLIPMIYFVYLSMRSRNRNERNFLKLIFYLLQVFVISCFTLVIWTFHVFLSFSEVENKFEVSVTSIQSVYAGKTLDDIHNIIRLFLEYMTDITERPIMGIILFNVIAVVMCLISVCILHRKWKLPKMLGIMNGILILYFSGILGMYLFFMPLEEAMYLAGIERYASTIVIFFGGVLTMCATIDLENSFFYRIGEVPDYQSFKSITTKSIYNNSVLICFFLTILILTSEYNGLEYYIVNYDTTLPAKVESVVGDNWSKDLDTTRYLVYASDEEEQVTSLYLEYIAKYYLRANNVDTISVITDDTVLALFNRYDVLIIIETDETIQSIMQENLGVTGDIGCYNLEEVL